MAFQGFENNKFAYASRLLLLQFHAQIPSCRHFAIYSFNTNNTEQCLELAYQTFKRVPLTVVTAAPTFAQLYDDADSESTVESRTDRKDRAQDSTTCVTANELSSMPSVGQSSNLGLLTHCFGVTKEPPPRHPLLLPRGGGEQPLD